MKDFKDWLQANALLLAGRPIDEVAELAMAVGFDPVIVSQWKTQARFNEAANG